MALTALTPMPKCVTTASNSMDWGKAAAMRSTSVRGSQIGDPLRFRGRMPPSAAKISLSDLGATPIIAAASVRVRLDDRRG